MRWDLWCKDLSATKTKQDKIIDLDARSFEEIISSGKNVLVDFWAEWCKPCKMIEPILERLVTKYGNEIIFARVNVENEMDISSRYQIMSIPTFIIFKDGVPVNTIIGAVGEDTLEQFILRSIRKDH